MTGNKSKVHLGELSITIENTDLLVPLKIKIKRKEKKKKKNTLTNALH